MAITIDQETSFILHGPEVKDVFIKLLRNLHGDDCDIDNMSFAFEMASLTVILTSTLKEIQIGMCDIDMSDNIEFIPVMVPDEETGEPIREFVLKEHTDDDTLCNTTTHSDGEIEKFAMIDQDRADIEFMSPILELAYAMLKTQQHIDCDNLPLKAISFLEPDTIRVVI